MAQPQLAYTKEPQVEIATIASSAVLIDVHVSTWTGRKRDKKTTQEVNDDKQTTTNRAASVIKNLMCDDKELDAIRAYAQDTRLWLHKNTLAWHDNGTRLLPSAAIFDVTSELEARIVEFDTRVKNFVAGYPVKISAAAFKLGQLGLCHFFLLTFSRNPASLAAGGSSPSPTRAGMGRLQGSGIHFELTE